MGLNALPVFSLFQFCLVSSYSVVARHIRLDSAVYVLCPMDSFFFLHKKAGAMYQREEVDGGEQGLQVAVVTEALDRRPGDGSLCLSSLTGSFVLFIHMH